MVNSNKLKHEYVNLNVLATNWRAQNLVQLLISNHLSLILGLHFLTQIFGLLVHFQYSNQKIQVHFKKCLFHYGKSIMFEQLIEN